MHGSQLYIYLQTSLYCIRIFLSCTVHQLFHELVSTIHHQIQFMHSQHKIPWLGFRVHCEILH